MEGEKRKERKKKQSTSISDVDHRQENRGKDVFSAGCCGSVATPGRETILQALVVGVRVARGLDK